MTARRDLTWTCGHSKMGSSFTEFRGFGFWSRDGHLMLWLRALVREIDDHGEVPKWLKDAREHWKLHGSGMFNGCISPGLDDILRSDEQRSIVRLISIAAQTDLLAQGGEISRSYLERLDSLDDFGSPLPIDGFANVARRWLALLDDNCVEEFGPGHYRVQRYPPQPTE
jgi:hypothetical protein